MLQWLKLVSLGPGSFIEVSKLLSQLKGDDQHPAFHVVAPSLPNFGFSSGVTRRGFGLAQYAETVHKLMLKLGYTQYGRLLRSFGHSPTNLYSASNPRRRLGVLGNKSRRPLIPGALQSLAHQHGGIQASPMEPHSIAGNETCAAALY